MLKSLLTSIYWLVSSPNKSSTTGALQPLLLGDPTGSCGLSGLKFDWAVTGCSPDEGDLRVPGEVEKI